MPPARSKALWLATLVASAAGLALTALSWPAIGTSARIQASRGETLRALARLQERATRDQAALRIYETLGALTATDPAAAVPLVAPDTQVQAEGPRDQKLPGGWIRREWALNFDALAPVDAGRLVEYLENQRPPWRLAACDFTALEGGRARVHLELETIVRGETR